MISIQARRANAVRRMDGGEKAETCEHGKRNTANCCVHEHARRRGARTARPDGWRVILPTTCISRRPRTSWLDQVERWFATLTRKQICRGTHRSTVELEQPIRNYLDFYNRSPKPFVWTKSADQILESIKRFCVRTSNSGH